MKKKASDGRLRFSNLFIIHIFLNFEKFRISMRIAHPNTIQDDRDGEKK